MRVARFGDRDRRARRWRTWWVVVRWIVALGAIIVAGVYAYGLGTRLARQDVARLVVELGAARTERDQANAERDALAAALDAAKAETEAWRARHAAEVPTGDVAALAALARDRLAAGVPADRLAFVLGNAGPLRDCGAPQTKRFLVQTPLGSGAGSSVSFADGTVTVTATGASAKDAAGNPLARFDPAKPVTVRFQMIDGGSTEAMGILPVDRSVVLGTSEHRFAVVAGEGGFANVTAESCAFP